MRIHFILAVLHSHSHTHMHASLRPRILLRHRLPDNLPFPSILLSQLLDVRAIKPAFFLPRSQHTVCLENGNIQYVYAAVFSSFSHLVCLSCSVQIVRVRFESCWIACVCKISTIVVKLDVTPMWYSFSVSCCSRQGSCGCCFYSCLPANVQACTAHIFHSELCDHTHSRFRLINYCHVCVWLFLFQHIV